MVSLRTRYVHKFARIRMLIRSVSENDPYRKFARTCENFHTKYASTSRDRSQPCTYSLDCVRSRTRARTKGEASMSDIAKLRGILGLTQKQIGDKAFVAKSVISEVENSRRGLSVAVAVKAAPVLEVDPGELYLATNLAAVKAKIVDGDISPEDGAEKLIRVLRKVLEHFGELEGDDADALVDELEDLIAQGTSVATKGIRGSGSTFVDAQVRLAQKAIPAEEYEVDDNRDLYGRALSGNLRDEEESRFPDIGGFDMTDNQIPYDDDDEDDEDGRDLFGRRTRPLR